MNTTSTRLFSIEPPWIHVGHGEPDRQKWVPSRFYSREVMETCVRRLRGGKMRTVQGLMDEFGAALQFFEDFGENWYALLECLEYLDEWLPAEAYILVVENAGDVLVEADSGQLDALLKTLHEAGEWWSREVTGNGRFNRPPRPFHTLLHVSPDAAPGVERLAGAAHRAGVPIRIEEASAGT